MIQMELGGMNTYPIPLTQRLADIAFWTVMWLVAAGPVLSWGIYHGI